MSAGDKPRSSTTVLVRALSAILLLEIVALAMLLLCNTQRTDDRRKLRAPRPPELVNLESGQLAAINAYRMVDEQQGIVAIPIDRAIELYVAEAESSPAPTTTNVPGDQ